MKNIYLIVGPSGSGKSSVARELEKRYGFGEIQSYTERPRRYPVNPATRSSHRKSSMPPARCARSLSTMATATAFRSRW